MRHCFCQDIHGNTYLVAVRWKSNFDEWLKWANSVDPNSEEFSDRFPVGNRLTLDPPGPHVKLPKDISSYSFSNFGIITNCGKKLECGSSCVDEMFHEGECICRNGEDCPG